VRAQAGQFFGHVDAQGKEVGFLRQAFGQFRAGNVRESAGECGFDAFAQLGGLALAVVSQQLRQMRLHDVHDARDAIGAFAHHAGQAFAFALAAFLKLCQGLLRGLQARGAPDLRVQGVVAALAGPVEQFGQTRGRDVRNDAARGLQLFGQAVEPGGIQLGQVGVGRTGEGHADFDLAAGQVGGQQLAQGRFHVAQFVRKTEIQVEKAAVDAAQFYGESALF